MVHDSRCPKCKTTIYFLLYEIFGNITQKYKADKISTNIEDYAGTKFYVPLKNIFDKLVEYRKYNDFIKSKYLQRSDIFVDSCNLIIELDETQHFTYPRLLTLENYPDIIKTGYDIDMYIKLCKNTNSKDNNPIYRDEQRAWYDTIRDFLPLITDNIKKPTIRIPLGYYKWCELDPKKEEHKKLFKEKILL